MMHPAYVNGHPIGGVTADGLAEPTFPELWTALSREAAERFKSYSDFSCPSTSPEIDDDSLARITKYEKEWKTVIPLDLKTISCWKGICDAVFHALPLNNFYAQPSYENGWHLYTIKSTGEHAVRFMDENQGCCYWFAAWRDGGVRCRVYVSEYPSLYPDPRWRLEEEEEAKYEPRLTSDSLVAFFAGYAKDGAESLRKRHPPSPFGGPADQAPIIRPTISDEDPESFYNELLRIFRTSENLNNAPGTNS
jgi:hypothetical protein